MNPLLERWKRPLRNSFRYSQVLLRGYPFHYTRHQNPEQAALYPHLWSQSATPLPDRGSPEIRQNRIWNLQLAVSKINYLQLHPQKIFSFSDRVGEPTLAAGFRSGPVFVRGGVSTGVGGGLCLVATNLFQTFLQAGCQILERHCHSIDAYGEKRFYTLGEDAAVAYGYKDLIVRNQSSVPLQLRSQVLPAEGQVISSLWGASPCPWETQIESKILQEIPSLCTDGLPGWVVETVRQVRDRPDSLTNNHQDPVASNLGWCIDYQAISTYQPCRNS